VYESATALEFAKAYDVDADSSLIFNDTDFLPPEVVTSTFTLPFASVKEQARAYASALAVQYAWSQRLASEYASATELPSASASVLDRV
jgi:hypothetical protein